MWISAPSSTATPTAGDVPPPRHRQPLVEPGAAGRRRRGGRTGLIAHDAEGNVARRGPAPSMLPARAVRRSRAVTAATGGRRAPDPARPGDAGARVRPARRRGRRPACTRTWCWRPASGPWSARASRSRCRPATRASCTPVRGWPRGAGLSMVNAPGTIDAGYRGEILVCLINHDPRSRAAPAPRRPDRAAGRAARRARPVRRGRAAAVVRARCRGLRLDGAAASRHLT